MSEYPIWVYTAIIDGDLPWDQSSKNVLEYFRSKYLIGDSSWIGLFLNLTSANTAILGIRWDIWPLNDDEILAENKGEYEWPYLFIKIEGIKQISTWNYDLVEDVGRPLSNLEIETINENHILAISDVYDGELQIEFTGDTYLLVLNKDRNLLSI